jgi:hypothetical protein
VAPETFDFDVFEEGPHELVGQGDVCRNARTCVDADGRRYFDFDADGTVDYSLEDRDFNVRSLVGNVVSRGQRRLPMGVSARIHDLSGLATPPGRRSSSGEL